MAPSPDAQRLFHSVPRLWAGPFLEPHLFVKTFFALGAEQGHGDLGPRQALPLDMLQQPGDDLPADALPLIGCQDKNIIQIPIQRPIAQKRPIATSSPPS